MKSRDLVVVAVRHDHRLGRIGVRHLANEFSTDAQLVQTGHILGTVAAHGGHGQGCTAQLLQAIGDIAGTAAKLAAQSRHQKRHIEDVQLVRQNLLGKSPFKTHDGVKGKGTTNYSRHGCLNSIKDKKQGRGNQQYARRRSA
jgi:hypothetical protein